MLWTMKLKIIYIICSQCKIKVGKMNIKFCLLNFYKYIEKTQIIQYNVIDENTKERKISMFDEIVTKEGLKFNDLEKKIYKFVCMLGCFIIKSILESRDRKLMKARDTKKFRHKGYKNNCIKTIMG